MAAYFNWIQSIDVVTTQSNSLKTVNNLSKALSGSFLGQIVFFLPLRFILTKKHV